MSTVKAESGVLAYTKDKATDWYAWNNLMPPGPPSIHVVGTIEVPNPGVEPSLTERVPQGINHSILLLNLDLIQMPGIWPQHVVRKQVRFDKVKAVYSEVFVFADDVQIAKIEVRDVF
jgi:hypothetical protein